jgi:hypothetical protein
MGRLWASVVVGCGLALAACGGGTGHCSDPAPVAGNWHGTLNDEGARQTGNVAVTFTQDACTLTGTWQQVFPSGGAAFDGTFTVSGFVQGTTLVFGLTPDNDTIHCQVDVTATVVGATQITGSYANHQACSENDAGTFTLNAG